METFLVTLVVLLVVMVASSVGYIFMRKELKGSCGGLGNVMGEDCMFCDKKEECDNDPEQKGECVKLECTPDQEVELSVTSGPNA